MRVAEIRKAEIQCWCGSQRHPIISAVDVINNSVLLPIRKRGAFPSCVIVLTGLKCCLDKHGMAPEHGRAVCSVPSVSMRIQKAHAFVIAVAQSWKPYALLANT